MSAHNAATTEMLAAVVDGDIPVAEATHADSADEATVSEKLGTGAGSSTRPCYIDENGTPQQVGNTINVNISGTAASAMNAANATNADHATTADSATNATNATNAQKATADAAGNTISTTYATKTENAAKLNKPTIEQYNIAASAWTALSNADPFTVQATVTATTTIGADAIIELYNDQPVAFATYAFSIASVSGQTITFYALEAPTAQVTLSVGITN